MNYLALKMLAGDRAKYVGIVMGLTFASLLITQQAGIYSGLMTRTYSQITDTSSADLWVTDPEVEFVEDMKRMLDRELYRVRGVEGVQWAVPGFKGYFNTRLPGGKIAVASVIGIDDVSLIGGPPEMVEGKLEDLRQRDAVIVDIAEASGKLARRPAQAGDAPAPLKVGDVLEINDRRAVVVGFCRVSPSFYWQPVIYTLHSRASTYVSSERRPLSYVLVKVKQGYDHADVCDRINRETGLLAQTSGQFSQSTLDYVNRSTGIAINFGMAIALGFVVGAAIAGQTFYNFTLDNLRYFAALKAMGASHGTMLRMILIQALAAGLLGYGLGVGAATIFGNLAGQQLAFRLSFPLLAGSGLAIVSICMVAAGFSMRKVLRLEPAMVFKS
ncbi:MAG TPA: ABC transporter permease [Tepidisphaeraceae bacterium]|nr:ABC transporter permease [Tepidisphaeraceae bacterium]